MNQSISIDREFAIVILLIGVYIFSYHIPLFAEYMDKRQEIVSASPPDATQAAKPEGPVVKSDYFTVYCEEGVNLKTIERRLTRRSLFFGGSSSSSSDEGLAGVNIARKIDGLMERVRDLLDMHTKTGPIKIRVFKDKDKLNNEYFKLFNTETDFNAFYIYKYDTIYISAEDISESVLAHEMGHAVVDHYFSATPPEKVGEVLASYVDLHLEDE